MSTEQRTPIGMRHLTVVPENFEPTVDADRDERDRPERNGDGHVELHVDDPVDGERN